MAIPQLLLEMESDGRRVQLTRACIEELRIPIMPRIVYLKVVTI